MDSSNMIRPRPKIVQSPASEMVKNITEKSFNIVESTGEPEEGFGVSSVWDAKDEDKLLDIMHDIRKNRDKRYLVMSLVNDSVDNFYEKKLDSSTNSLEVKPKVTSIDHNVITHPGITLTNKNITGEDMTRFLYIMSGEGNTQIPTIHSPGIEDENARVSILDTGFFFTAGTALFQGAVFVRTIQDAVVKTFGSATHYDPNSTGYTVFWVNRILDTSKYVRHFQNKTVYSHLHIIDRRSRLSE